MSTEDYQAMLLRTIYAAFAVTPQDLADLEAVDGFGAVVSDSGGTR